MSSIILIGVGLLLSLLAQPKILNRVRSWLINQGLLTARYVKAKDTEVVSGGGQNLNLFILGMVLIFVGIFLNLA